MLVRPNPHKTAPPGGNPLTKQTLARQIPNGVVNLNLMIDTPQRTQARKPGPWATYAVWLVLMLAIFGSFIAWCGGAF